MCVAVSVAENVDVSRGGGSFRFPRSDDGVKQCLPSYLSPQSGIHIGGKAFQLKEIAPSLPLLA